MTDAALVSESVQRCGQCSSDSFRLVRYGPKGLVFHVICAGCGRLVLNLLPHPGFDDFKLGGMWINA